VPQDAGDSSDKLAGMSLNAPLRETEQIVVGKALPFSIFSAEGKLLLAAGRVVRTENTRQILLKNGTHRGAFQGGDRVSRDIYKAVVTPPVSPLGVLQKAYRTAGPSRRFALTMARDGTTTEAYRTHVIGVRDNAIVVDAPVRSDGALVVVTPGQLWLCRTFQLTSAFRFSTTILKVAFEPYPHLHLGAPIRVERRKVRDRSRVAVLVNAALESHASAPCLLVDLSLGGGRIATETTVVLERGQPIRIAMKLELFDTPFELSLQAVVVGAFGASDRDHPDVLFHGIRFESLTQLELLVLHGFVSSHLATELNCLWQVLLRAMPADP